MRVELGASMVCLTAVVNTKSDVHVFQSNLTFEKAISVVAFLAYINSVIVLLLNLHYNKKKVLLNLNILTNVLWFCFIFYLVFTKIHVIKLIKTLHVGILPALPTTGLKQSSPWKACLNCFHQ